MSRPDLPRPEDAAFTEPWQAEALALSIALQETGHVTPAEWSDALGAEIDRARGQGDPADGTTYYAHVVAALERLVSEKGLLPPGALATRKQAWEDAYHRTPHGQPVTLDTDETTGPAG